MTAKLIDGRAHAEVLRQGAQEQASRFAKKNNRCIGLAVILVGDNPASVVYVNHKIKACREVGISSRVLNLSPTIDQQELIAQIQLLNQDPDVDGILLQMPLPAHLDAYQALNVIDPKKDVDGLTLYNQGLLMQGRPHLSPCTPQGCLQLIHYCEPQIKGKRAVVIGRSILVGRPMAIMLTNHHATVTLAHSQTQDLASLCREADILVAAIGSPRFIKRSFIKPGAIVIDVGMNRMSDGKLLGDVDFDNVLDLAGYITPVPGGVGPMTIANLLLNTVKAAEMTHKGG